jgi:hypothetical protein
MQEGRNEAGGGGGGEEKKENVRGSKEPLAAVKLLLQWGEFTKRKERFKLRFFP